MNSNDLKAPVHFTIRASGNRTPSHREAGLTTRRARGAFKNTKHSSDEVERHIHARLR